MDLADKKKELRGRKHSSVEIYAGYQKVHSGVWRKMRASKLEWIQINAKLSRRIYLLATTNRSTILSNP